MTDDGLRLFADPDVLAVTPPDHGADPPTAVALEELEAVDAAVDRWAAAGVPGLVGAEDVRHLAELPRLAPDLRFPEARQRAGIDHLLEVALVGGEIELEHAVVG